MSATTTQLAAYLRLPADASEDLGLYLNAAKAELEKAGVAEVDHENDAQYDLAVLAFAAFNYENRGLAASGSYQQAAISNAQAMKNSMILQLRNSTSASDEGGDEP